mmetsp:Transcript_5817/g.8570  ORF Transcript_5817/g.8570 Transcript_5817/m.8570 type:complete len:81 (+) Transcript_5817:1198-1440(+)
MDWCIIQHGGLHTHTHTLKNETILFSIILFEFSLCEYIFDAKKHKRENCSREEKTSHTCQVFFRYPRVEVYISQMIVSGM